MRFLLTFCILFAIPAKLFAMGDRLPWPLELSSWPYQFGPSFGQYQSLGSIYFHTGQDIVAEAGQNIFSPVSGKIAGGYYSYSDLPSGHSIKQFVPLGEAMLLEEPPLWGNRFFEVSITDENGYRFELHHVDPYTLPREVFSKILMGGDVLQGEAVGHVIDFQTNAFGTDYNHIHYNIYSPRGEYINPMFFSESVNDIDPPRIKRGFIGPIGSCKTTSPGQLFRVIRQNESNPFFREVFFEIQDDITGNKIPLAPSRVSIFLNGEHFKSYDFSINLSKKYSILDIYQRHFCVGDPDYPIAIEGSSTSKVYYKFSLPEGFSGSVEIQAADFAGNSSRYKFTVAE